MLEGPFRNSLERALRAGRVQFAAVGLFSGVVNLLQLTVSLYMMQVFDRVLATRSTDTLLYLTLIAVAALALLGLLEGVRSTVMHRLAAWIEACVIPEAFARAVEARLKGLPYGMEILRDLSSCRNFVGSPAALALYDIPWVPIFIAVIFLFHPVMGWIALAGAALLFALTLLNEVSTAGLVRRAGQGLVVAQQRAEAIARNAEVIDSMGMLPALLARWGRDLDQAGAPQSIAADRAALVTGITKFARLAVQIAVLAAGAWLVLRGEVTAGASIAGSIILGRALAPVEQLVGGWRTLVQARAARGRITAFLALPRLRPDSAPLPPPRGALAVERATYAFPGQSAPTVKAVTFSLEAGESLAIIGPSAAGKTTLLRMIMGTLAPSNGVVRLDGANVHLWPREDFGRHVGYLPQAVELFAGTVMENIGRMATAPLPEAVYEAAMLAGCHEMILRLPQGYDTDIGEAGQLLSGGQRQLVGLARAVYGSPRLVVLDEPNSNLDGDSETHLVTALRALRAAGTTVVVVSHRPSLVQAVEKVLLLREGAVETFGPRAEVVKRLLSPARASEGRGRIDGKEAAI